MGSNFAVVSQSFVYTIVIALILLFLFLIKRSLKSPVEYKPRVTLSIILIIIGFIAGLLIRENIFGFVDYFQMLIFLYGNCRSVAEKR